jgi:hypothetical protein
MCYKKYGSGWGVGVGWEDGVLAVKERKKKTGFVSCMWWLHLSPPCTHLIALTKSVEKTDIYFNFWPSNWRAL